MFSTDFIFRQQENLVDNQKCQAGFRPLCNKILLSLEKLAILTKNKQNYLSETLLQIMKAIRPTLDADVYQESVSLLLHPNSLYNRVKCYLKYFCCCCS